MKSLKQRNTQEKPLNLGPKPSLKGDFQDFGRRQNLEDGGGRLESIFSSPLAIFLSLTEMATMGS